MRNCLIAQSGGPTVAINASLAGVIDASLKSDKINKIYGAKNGIQGVLNDNLVELNDTFADRNNLLMLKNTPSMYLGSCRYKLTDYNKDSTDYDKICQILEKYNIGYFFYIGGNDSMDTVAKVAAYSKEKGLDVCVIGIPKTIDNDLTCIDHTPGFGSAAKYIATSVLEMAHDTYIYDMDTVLIVEIMGRNAGWLTAAASLARTEYSKAPHLIYLPERAFDKDKFVCDVKELLKTRHHVIIAVSEGIKDKDGVYMSAKGSKTDKFGHVMLSGTGKVLESIISEEIGCKVRSVELNVLQRAASHIASKTDIEESFMLGSNGVKLAMDGRTGVMSSAVRVSDKPYELSYGEADITKVANFEKMIPSEWINKAGNDVLPAMEDYLRPLIQGENEVIYKDGMPQYIFME